jgi:hypothetical protein
VNNVRCEVSRHFRKRNREYLKEKINEFATDGKNNSIKTLYRGISKFNRATNLDITQCRIRMFADLHNILNRWKKCIMSVMLGR